MEKENIHLLIVSPEKTLFDEKVEYVQLPGSKGSFAVFENHASLISSLDNGNITFKNHGNIQQITIRGGFVEVDHNEVSVCVTQ